MSPLTPHDALLEIAALLERERASRYRSKAFRSAAAAIAEVPVAELVSRLRFGKIAGVGDSSKAVILQAAAGEVPEYLAELRAKYDAPPSALRVLLRGDLHAHSDWSDGQTSIAAMASAARALGHEYLALTDHSPRLTIARGLTAERLRAQLSDIDRYSTPTFTLLSGIEVDILSDGSLDQTRELLHEVEVVIASAHSALQMPKAEMTRRLLKAVKNPATLVLGHCTGRLIAGDRGRRPQSDFDAHAVFAACAERGVAVEINCKPERLDPPDDLLHLAHELGCLFAIDSDAHAPGHLAYIDDGAARAESLGIEPERIITTWPLDKLREHRQKLLAS